MIILGLNAYLADSAACLLVDGKLVVAAEEERFRRIKHWAGLPTQAIDYCLREARLNFGDVDHIAINRQPSAHNWRRFEFLLTHQSHPKLMWEKIKNIRSAASIKETLEKQYNLSLKADLHHVEHHLAHLASAFLVSGFTEAACLSVDGFGDFTSTALGFGKDDTIKIDDRIYFPHSLGVFYSALTQFVGFPNYGDEYKVMALAAHGEPSFVQQLREVLLIQPDGTFLLNLRYFRHHTGNISFSWKNCAPGMGTLYQQTLVDLLGPPRKEGEPIEQKHKDIARSVQTIYEKALFELLQALHKQHPSENLALAGSCALNSVANGKICRRTPFKKIYLPPAAGDAGGALGAAVYVHSTLNAQLSSDLRPLTTAYFGPQSPQVEIYAVIDWKRNEIAAEGCLVTIFADEEALLRHTAHEIADGKVVGWFQDRAEWGPSALGHRSILADPRRSDMKEIVNAKIKRHEAFRPFALSILREAVSEWFDQEADVPFMTEALSIRSKHRALIPAVTHLDGSGRLQTVDKETSPRFHRLIEYFQDIAEVPMLLNTSLNANEPMICYPEEALACFLRTKMDVLVLGNYLLTRGR